MKRFVVYTAIVGDYDEVRQPLVVDDDFDYLLFSDMLREKRIGVWEVRLLDYHNEVKTKMARWVKTHPEQLLSEYEYSVWIDASVVIVDGSFYSRVKELSIQNEIISTLVHPDWACAYQEMLHIMYLGWEAERTTLDWGRFMRVERFPRNLGTFETRVLFRQHSEPNIETFDELWWNCIEHYSRRDQYSFSYCLWKRNIKCVGFLPKEYDAHDNDYFVVEKHRGKPADKIVEGGDKSWLMRYYMKHVDERQKIENAYYWIYGRKYYILWLGVLGQYYRIRHLALRVMGRKEVYMWEIEKNKYA